MKKNLLVLSTIFCLATLACTKSADPLMPVNPLPDPPKDTAKPSMNYPVSYSLYTGEYDLHTRQDIELRFDANKKLAGIHILRYDTIGGTPSVDSSLFTFPFTARGVPPTGYDYRWTVSTSPYFKYGASEHHALWYDLQGRVIKDSLVSWSSSTLADDYFYKTVFGYSNDRIDWTGVSYGSTNGALDFSKDTLKLAGGHIDSWTHYLIGDPDSSSQRNYTYQYGVDRNPLFDSTVSKTIAPLLMYYRIGDFISPVAANQNVSYHERYTQSTSRQYSISKDTNGNILQLAGTATRGGGGPEIWTFKY